MLAKRIIPCLDVKDGVVVKGVRFRDHVVMGDVLELAARYSDEGADELVFYDITASSDGRVVGSGWVEKVARSINIPFCVAGGIRSISDARRILNSGADKISVNSPALERPEFISELSAEFGAQCVVVGIDSHEEDDGTWSVWQYTGDETRAVKSKRETVAWAIEAQRRGAGEIVLNCMNRDGVRKGYDIRQLAAVRAALSIPLIASGGAGEPEHFRDVFDAGVDGALAAGAFHSGKIRIPELKRYLAESGVPVRI